MPSITGEFAGLSQWVWLLSTFLLLDGADDADLIAKFAVGFCDRVDVEAGRFGAASESGELLAEGDQVLSGCVLVPEEDDSTFGDYASSQLNLLSGLVHD